MRTQTYILGTYQYIEAMNLIEVLKDHPGVCLGRVSLAPSTVCVLEDLFDWDRGKGLKLNKTCIATGENMRMGRAAVSKRPVRDVEHNIPRIQEQVLIDCPPCTMWSIKWRFSKDLQICIYQTCEIQ